MIDAAQRGPHGADEVVPYARRAGADRGLRRRGGGARRRPAPDRRRPRRRQAVGRWRAALGEAMAAGMDVEAGLHTRARRRPGAGRDRLPSGRRPIDLRVGPADLDTPDGPDERDPSLRVVQSVGSDCAIGKMSVTLELDRAARARGERSVFVATGPDRDRDLRLGHRRRSRDLGLHRRCGGAPRPGRAPSAATCCSWRGRDRSTPGLLRRHPRSAARRGAGRAAALPPGGADRDPLVLVGPPIPPLAELVGVLRGRRRRPSDRRASARSP